MKGDGFKAAHQRKIDCGDLVPNDGLREAFERSSMSANELASALGWSIPNGQRVRRLLGLKPDGGSLQKHLNYETAERMAEILGLDPYEAGF